MEVFTEDDWHLSRKRHEARVRQWVAKRLERASRHQRHPVEDFLFEYYPYRPAKLLCWHPGFGVALQGESARSFLSHKYYRETAQGITVDILELPPSRKESIRWLYAMLRRTTERAASFGCRGLHEWAMLYRTDHLRHSEWPLRVTPRQIAHVVESLQPRCTHYDAFRFFTPAARPFNKYQPTRQTAAAFEQPGCLHANMDLYKWAFKLAPFSSSELVADCFELAHHVRTLDMRASPYDLTALGYAPVCIESAEGSAEYEAQQREFAKLAVPLRKRLIGVCESLVEVFSGLESSHEKTPFAAK